MKNIFKFSSMILIVFFLSASFISAFAPPSPNQEQFADDKVKLCESTGGVAEKKTVGGYDPQTGKDMARGIIVNCKCSSDLIWNASVGCMVKTASIDSNKLQDFLIQLRKDKEDFKTNKLAEEKENANILKEKIASKKKEIQARLEKAKQNKEAKRKAVLVRLIDIQIKQLKNTKDRVAKMTNIKADLKASLNAKVDEAVGELEEEKAILQAITAPEGLKKFAKELKDSLKTKRDIVKRIVNAILASRADKTISAAEGRLAEIKAKVADLKAAGQDTVALDNLLTAAKEKIAAASAKIGKKELKEAINDLKDAYKDIKSIAEKVEGKPAINPSPVSASPMISNSPVSFQCPEEQSFNCMPGPDIPIERQRLCSGEYHRWIQTNCPNVQFAY